MKKERKVIHLGDVINNEEQQIRIVRLIDDVMQRCSRETPCEATIIVSALCSCLLNTLAMLPANERLADFERIVNQLRAGVERTLSDERN